MSIVIARSRGGFTSRRRVRCMRAVTLALSEVATELTEAVLELTDTILDMPDIALQWYRDHEAGLYRESYRHCCPHPQELRSQFGGATFSICDACGAAMPLISDPS